jgi:serine/threonine protein kinase
MANLTGAIVFLHNELETSTFEKLPCWHLDLKPQNVLIVIENNEEIWKISDFNMSRAKPKRRQDDLHLITFGTWHDKVLKLNDMFEQGNLTEATMHGHRTGTYLAPEATFEILGGIQAKSDIWFL